MTTIRIMTANLLVDRVDVDALGSVIDDVRPDIVCVQELRTEPVDTIASSHPHGLLDARDDFHGMGIAAIAPITVEALGLPGRRALVATLDPESWDGLESSVGVVNAHLLNPILGSWRTTQATRRQQIAGIRRHVESAGRPTIIVGDMNASPRWPEYRLLTEFGTDAAEATGNSAPTWAQFRTGPRWLRIDHVFVRGLTPERTFVRKVRGSDHLALVADVDTAAPPMGGSEIGG